MRDALDQKLKESEESYRSLFDSLSELVYIQDMDGCFVAVNEAVVRRYGYSREEIVGRRADFLADASRTDMEDVQTLFRLACEGKPQHLEFWARTREGESFPKEITLARGRYFGQDVIIGVARDITHRKRAEAVAERSRDFYMSILDRFPALIWRADPNGSCGYFNEAWLEFTGRSLEQERGRGWVEGIHPDDNERREEITRQAFAAREAYDIEYRLRHHTGSYRWIRDFGRPVHNLEGQFLGFIGGAFDIDAHRRTEVQLRQAQKMEAVGRLAGGIAHDSNNVLLVIKANAQLALLDLSSDSLLHQELKEIEAGADRAANLTRQLLSFSRQEIVQPRILDLNRIIVDMEKMLRRTLGEDIELVSVLAPDLGQVSADPGQVEQILMNFAVNARDAMPTGGKLITETKNFEVRRRPAVAYANDVRPGSYVMLSVSDTGSGMPAQIRDRVFEPFFTTKPQGQGTGLGLATVYGIVKQSDGYVWLYSEEARGTTFTVLLPRLDAEIKQAGHSEVPTAPQKSATILLVEDEATVRSTARRMLERLGHEVLEAKNGEEGLRIAEQNDGDFDLLMTDVVMPLMGGRELAEQVCARWPGVRVLYTSGYTNEAVMRHGIKEGSVLFLQKPYDNMALADKVAEVLNQPKGTGE